MINCRFKYKSIFSFEPHLAANDHLVLLKLSLLMRRLYAEALSVLLTLFLNCLTQVSQLISVPTLVARLSHSVCLTTGRSSQETQWTQPANLVPLWRTPANARVSKKVFQPWTTTWINCKHLGLARLLPHSSLPYEIKYTHIVDRTVQNTVSTVAVGLNDWQWRNYHKNCKQ